MATGSGVQKPNGLERTSSLRTVYLAAGLLYPWWHLVAPQAVIDPWSIWWILGGSFASVALLAPRVAFVRRNQRRFFYACSWLVTAQLFVLAAINDMHPFYAVGSVMAMLATSVSMQSRPAILSYSVFAACLGGALFFVAPDLRKIAYWAGFLPVGGLVYYRLGVRLRAAAQMREQQERLEQRVEERTSQLSAANQRLQRELREKARLEEELRFSQKMEAVGRLAGGVAHEFNNLLTTIGVYADLVADELPDDSALRSDVEQIRKTTRQAATLTQQLLTFSRRRDVEGAVLELDEVLLDATSMLRHLLGGDTEFECQLSGGPYYVRVHRDQIEQALINLVMNARDAMPQGGIFRMETSRISAGQVKATDLANHLEIADYVLLSVSDTGVGMAPEVRARVFDPFYTTKAATKGTGLGLSIVYGIVDQAGGFVRALSEPGEGARFELYLRLAAGPPDPDEKPPDPLRDQRHGERVLLVEDEDDLRAVLHRVLSEDGFHVTEAPDGEAALKIASTPGEHFDLVVTDVVMPRMNGLELANHVLAAHPDTRVLLLSGQLNHPSIRGRELPSGLTLLVKPFPLDELRSTVREVMHRE